jgi:hypothetical protein
MRNLATALLLGSVLLAGAIAAPTLYAEDQQPSGSTTENGMMGNRDGKDGGGMMGMMKMMRQMSEMMDHCNNMMSNSRPNERWRKNSPSQPEKRG